MCIMQSYRIPIMAICQPCQKHNTCPCNRTAVFSRRFFSNGKEDNEVPILLVVILFACAIGIVIALLTLSIQRISRRVIEQYRDRLDDANTIVNQGRPPRLLGSAFSRAHRGGEGGARGNRSEKRERILTAHFSRFLTPAFPHAIAAPGRSNRSGSRPRGQCLKRLKRLISFMEKGAVL